MQVYGSTDPVSAAAAAGRLLGDPRVRGLIEGAPRSTTTFYQKQLADPAPKVAPEMTSEVLTEGIPVANIETNETKEATETNAGDTVSPPTTFQVRLLVVHCS
jgi:hypothetical protein